MQYLFLVILVGALGAGVTVLAWMGVAQRCRRNLLARTAHEMGMKFSPSDPFDLTGRYGDFVVSSAGHSPRAENVIHGRYGGWSVRAYDYRYETGHGPRRVGRRYSILVAETGLDLPAALLWHVDDTEHLPLAAQRHVGQAGNWLLVAGADGAPALAAAFAAFGDRPVNIQVRRGSVMLCSAERFKPRDLRARLDEAVSALAALRERADSA